MSDEASTGTTPPETIDGHRQSGQWRGLADTRFWQRPRHYAILSRILWFLMADRKWLSTGEAAKLCSVTPDAVQKWIRSRRLAAQKTPGGHYRIALEDITPFATGAGLRRWFPAPPANARRNRCAVGSI